MGVLTRQSENTDKASRLSIVIPTCGRWQALKTCLAAIEPQCRAIGCEVIVSDDGCDDTARSEQALEHGWATFIEGPRRGPAANRNCGASHTSGDWIVFLDDDVVPEADLLAVYDSAMQEADEKTVAFEGAIEPVGSMEGDALDCPSNLSGGCFWSANIAVRASVFAVVGGFDERFRMASQEDTDLYWRLKAVGDVLFLPNARVGHPVKRLGWRRLSWKDLSERRRAQALLLLKRATLPPPLRWIAKEIIHDLLFWMRWTHPSIRRGRWINMLHGAQQAIFGTPLLLWLLWRRDVLNSERS